MEPGGPRSFDSCQVLYRRAGHEDERFQSAEAFVRAVEREFPGAGWHVGPGEGEIRALDVLYVDGVGEAGEVRVVFPRPRLASTAAR